MEANGQSSLLGVPLTVKSCSRDDSEMGGMAEELAAEILSAEGPECMATPLDVGWGAVRIFLIRPCAATILSRWATSAMAENAGYVYG